MKPTIGRIVIYRLAGNERNLFTNNAEELPAVITRVWSDTCVNLKVFNDGNQDFWRTSVLVDDGNLQPGVWRWPERS